MDIIINNLKIFFISLLLSLFFMIFGYFCQILLSLLFIKSLFNEIILLILILISIGFILIFQDLPSIYEEIESSLLDEIIIIESNIIFRIIFVISQAFLFYISKKLNFNTIPSLIFINGGCFLILFLLNFFVGISYFDDFSYIMEKENISLILMGIILIICAISIHVFYVLNYKKRENTSIFSKIENFLNKLKEDISKIYMNKKEKIKKYYEKNINKIKKNIKDIYKNIDINKIKEIKKILINLYKKEKNQKIKSKLKKILDYLKENEEKKQKNPKNPKKEENDDFF